MALDRYSAAGAARGCELRPPGSFAVCAGQAFDAYVSRELRTLVEVVTFNVRQFQPVGVILAGSLARGEGVLAAGADGRTRWLSDIECLVVIADGARGSSGSLGEALGRAEAALRIEAKTHAAGLGIQLSPIQASRLARLRPTIFARELAAHGKLLWGRPEAIAMPANGLTDARALRADAFRLLNNRIMEQVAARARCAEGRATPLESGYALSKFWNELATSLSVFLNCYRTSYRQRWQAIGDALTAPHCPLDPEIAGAVLERLDASMRVRTGKLDASQWPREAGFEPAAGLAERIWHWESGRMMRAPGAGGVDGWRVIPRRLRRVATLSQSARDWARWFLRPDVSRRMGPRALIQALYAGSPGNAIHAAGCLLDFFWNDVGAGRGCGPDIARTLGALFGLHAGRALPSRAQLAGRAVAAWRSHLRNAAL